MLNLGLWSSNINTLSLLKWQLIFHYGIWGIWKMCYIIQFKMLLAFCSTGWQERELWQNYKTSCNSISYQFNVRLLSSGMHSALWHSLPLTCREVCCWKSLESSRPWECPGQWRPYHSGAGDALSWSEGEPRARTHTNMLPPFLPSTSLQPDCHPPLDAETPMATTVDHVKPCLALLQYPIWVTKNKQTWGH